MSGSLSIKLRRPRRTMLWSSASSTRKHTLLRQRQSNGKRGALAGAARERNRSAQLAHTLLDPAQSEPPGATLRIQPDAVVTDRHVDAVVVRAHADTNGGRARVTHTIGQRLLHDAINARSMLVG